MEKVTETHLEKLIQVCLMNLDIKEMLKEFTMKKTKAKLSSTIFGIQSESSEETDDEELLDFNATIREESTIGNLESKKKFFFKYLKQKIVQIQE